jgi:hypothetical protein
LDGLEVQTTESIPGIAAGASKPGSECWNAERALLWRVLSDEEEMMAEENNRL